jgi:hypothetical protein
LPELRVCVERRLLELSRQLAEERQKSRQDRLNMAKLQQELARHKSEHPLREVLIKELERERRLRVEAENRLRDERLDTCDCKSQASELAKELAKVKEFAHSLIPYKGKFERLKEDYTSVTMNFECKLEGMRSEVGHLTDENSSLAAELSRLQKACSGCRLCSQTADCRLSVSGASHSDDSVAGGADKTKVLLERLKMLEAEKTSLILENEKQCEQYEKCLDDITSQVLQALMTQRCLKEECCKLRGRVSDLQRQNSELRQLFTQQNSPQHLMNNKVSSSVCIGGETSPEENHASSMWDGVLQPANAMSDLLLPASFGSLSSMYSDHEQMQYLVSRLASPLAVDLSDIGDGFSSVADIPTSSSYPLHCMQSPSVQQTEMSLSDHQLTGDDRGRRVSEDETAVAVDHTGSTVSLNELLDSCQIGGASAVVDCGDSVTINDWSLCGGGEGLGLHDDVSFGRLVSSTECAVTQQASVVTSTRGNAPTSALDVVHGMTSVVSSSGKIHHSRPSAASDVMSRSADSAMLQRSLAESSYASSSSSSSEPVRLIDDGYHSNTTSVTSPEGVACSGGRVGGSSVASASI